MLGSSSTSRIRSIVSILPLGQNDRKAGTDLALFELWHAAHLIHRCPRRCEPEPRGLTRCLSGEKRLENPLAMFLGDAPGLCPPRVSKRLRPLPHDGAP